MEEIKVSVIVPIYNVEKYIKKSLESIINQTLKEIEIICVNDGSLDSSRDIAQEYADKDSRIKIIDKENGGLSSARNAGMEIAKGEYIGFVDSDDWIEPTMYEKLYRKAKETDSEMVICGVHKYDDKTKQIVDDDPYYTLEYFNEKFTENTFNHFDTKKIIPSLPVAAWNKLYKRETLEKSNMKFPEGYIYEDIPFFFEYYIKLEKVSLIKDLLYNYRINRDDSIVASAGKKHVDRVDMMVKTLETIKQTPYYKDIESEIILWVVDDIFYRYLLIDYKYQREYFAKMKKVFSRIELENIDTKLRIPVLNYAAALIVKKYDFERSNKEFLLKYIATENKLRYHKGASKRRRLKLTEKNYVEKEEIKQIYEMHNINQKEWYEQKVHEQYNSQKDFLTYYFQEKLNKQDAWVAQEIERRLTDDRNWLEEKRVSDLDKQKEWYENEINNKVKSTEEWYEQEIKRRLTDLEEFYKQELNKQKEWYENEINNRVKNTEEWYEQENKKNLANLEEFKSKENNTVQEQLDQQYKKYEIELQEKLKEQAQWYKETYKLIKRDSLIAKVIETIKGKIKKN